MASASPSMPTPDHADIFECVVCLNYMMDRSPRMLSCHHTFCEDCLNHLLKNNKINCPTCREVTHIKSNVKELAVNFMLHKFRDMGIKEEGTNRTTKSSGKDLSKSFCQICEKKPPAYKCKDCPQLMCHPCTKEHNDIFRGHQVNDMCGEHEESITLLCKKCVRQLCMKCAVLDHKEHKAHFAEYKEGIQNLQEEAKSMISSLNKGISSIEAHLHHSAAQYKITANMKRDLIDQKENLAKQEKDVDKMLSVVKKNTDEYERIMVSCLEIKDLCADQAASMKTVTMDNTSFCSMYGQLKNQAEDTLANVKKILQIEYKTPTVTLEETVTSIVLSEPSFRNQPTGILQKNRLLLDIPRSNEINCHQQIAFIGSDLLIATHDKPQHVVRLTEHGQVVARYYPAGGPSNVFGVSFCQNRIYIAQSNTITVLSNIPGERTEVYQPNVDSISSMLVIDKSTIFISELKASNGKVYKYIPDGNKTEIILRGLHLPAYLNWVNTEEGLRYIVSELRADRINLYDNQWEKLYSFGGSSRLNFPQSTSITEKGILIADSSNDRISHYTLDGKLLGHIVTGLKFPEGIAYKYPHLWVCSLGDYVKCYEVKYKQN